MGAVRALQGPLLATVVMPDPAAHASEAFEVPLAIASLAAGFLLAWVLGRRPMTFRRLVPIAVYFIAAVVAWTGFVLYVQYVEIPRNEFHQFMKLQRPFSAIRAVEYALVFAVIHAHWGTLLVAVAFRRWLLREVLFTRAGALYLLAWAPWAWWVVRRLGAGNLHEVEMVLWLDAGLAPIALGIALAGLAQRRRATASTSTAAPRPGP